MSAVFIIWDFEVKKMSSQETATPQFDVNDIDFERRFGGIARLYGAAALQRFMSARVCVIGVGGVGSWVVEALARSAIGHLTMIDLDNIAESNVNRQIHANSATLGKAKVTALAERIALINPLCVVTEVEDFITPDNVAEMLGNAQFAKFDYVVDAIDNVKAKTALIAYCREHAIPLVTIGAAGGQIDPCKIEIRDLSRTEQEPLLALVRKRLRQNHGFPRGSKSKFGIDAVFSMEALTMPETEECAVDISDENASKNAAGISGLNCAGFGSSVVVTASFGLAAAGWVLSRLAKLPAQS